MQPNQPSLPPNYDFIMNNQPKQGGPVFLRNQDPRKRRLLTIGFVGVIILLLIIVVMAVFSGGSQSETDLKRVIAQQTEIVRVAELTHKETRDPALRNRLATLQAFTSSDLQQLASYAAQNGVSLNPQELASAQDSDTDAELESATQRGNFDDVAQTIIEQESAVYQQLISTAFTGSSSEKTRKLLSELNDNISAYSPE